jgi:hypothetical protein
MANDLVLVSLVSHECASAIGDERDAKEMLRKAFKAAKHHWMVTEPDPQLRGALNAVLTKMGDKHPDRERLETEIKLLGQMNAWLRAVQSGLSASPPEIPENFEAFGINGLWHEAA